MKYKYFSRGLSIVIVLFVLSSCSIEKRQHLSGYNVEWKKHNYNKSKKKDPELSIKEIEELEEKTFKPKITENVTASIDEEIRFIQPAQLTYDEQIISYNDTLKKVSRSFFNSFLKIENKYKKIKKSNDFAAIKDKAGFWFGIAGFAFGLLAVFSIVLAASSALYNILPFIISPLAIILNALSLKFYKQKFNESQWIRTLAKIGLILGIIVFAAVLIFSLWFILFFVW